MVPQLTLIYLFRLPGSFSQMPASPLVTWKTLPYPAKAKSLFSCSKKFLLPPLYPGCNSVLAFSKSRLNYLFVLVSFTRLGACPLFLFFFKIFYLFGGRESELARMQKQGDGEADSPWSSEPNSRMLGS